MPTKSKKHIGIPDLAARINSHSGELRKSEMRVAKYLHKLAGNRLDDTISQLAKKLETSESTISRTCKKLQYGNFNELKLAMAEEAKTAARFNPKRKIMFDPNDGLHQTETTLADLYLNTLEGIQHMLDSDKFEVCLDRIQASRKLIFAGAGESYFACQRGANLFASIGKDSRAIRNRQELILAVSNLKSDGMLIGLSHYGTNQSIADALILAGKNGASTVAVTSANQSIVAKAAETTLITWNSNTNSESVLGNTLGMSNGQLYMVELLYMGLFHRDPRTAMEKATELKGNMAN